MTPEQVKLKEYRAKMATLADLCDRDGINQYEARDSRPKTGCLPPITRYARVVTVGGSDVYVDQTEIRSTRFRTCSRMVCVAESVDAGRRIADAWVSSIPQGWSA
ncbi:hypothetical protein [Paraburkholderia sp. SIMBA_054]|uniref:hypothetical protein n=1 Tax=Paraburkholderia sp. SIMBA_054 TaxID=3085795 RepID=UPI00397DEC67